MTQSYPQAPKTLKRLFVLCIDICMDKSIVLLVGGSAPKEKESKMKLVATDTKVTIKWFVYAGEEKIARTSSMRGRWGYDAECSCGYETKTGGGVRTWVESMIEDHKRLEHNYTWKVGA